MFEALEASPILRTSPRLVAFAGGYIFLLGALVGIMIGHRHWELWDWAFILLQAAVLGKLLPPIYTDLRLRMKDSNGK